MGDRAPGRRDRTTQPTLPVMEGLEKRELLTSAIVTDRVLTVWATKHDDVVRVGVSYQNPSRYLVRVNDKKWAFSRRDIDVIRLCAGRGDDLVIATNKGGRITAKVISRSGPGEDSFGGILERKKRTRRGGGETEPQAPEGIKFPPGFRVFDATGFLDKPDLSLYGIEPVYLTGNDFWAGVYPDYDRTEPDETAVRRLAWKVARLDRPLVMDIEHWQTDIRLAPEAVVDESVRKLTQIVEWLKDEVPELEIGFFALLPADAWYTAQLPEDNAYYRQWHEASERLRPLAERVDFIAPCIYTRGDDRARWLVNTDVMLREAGSYGKPVYPFLWMDYSTGPMKSTPIAADYWAMELTAIIPRSNGVMIWGGWGVARESEGFITQLTWDDDAPWWEVTRRFLPA